MFAFAGFSNIRGKLEVKKDFFPIINNLKRLLFPPSIEGIRKRGKSKLRCAHLPKCTDKLAARGRVGIGRAGVEREHEHYYEGMEGTLKFKKETRQL